MLKSLGSQNIKISKNLWIVLLSKNCDEYLRIFYYFFGTEVEHLSRTQVIAHIEDKGLSSLHSIYEYFKFLKN